MGLDPDLISMLAATGVGVALSVAIERLMVPRPPLSRPMAAWAVHAGIWCLAHAALTLPLGRPWFAAALVSAFWLVLVQVNNAKYKSLREPFVFHDYEYFTDAVRHPRLYIPFLGWAKFSGATVGVLLAVAVGLWAEESLEDRWNWTGHLGGLSVVALSGGAVAVGRGAAPAGGQLPAGARSGGAGVHGLAMAVCLCGGAPAVRGVAFRCCGVCAASSRRVWARPASSGRHPERIVFRPARGGAGHS